MPVLEITEVIHLEPTDDMLFGFHVDFPVSSNSLNYYCFDVGGWVLTKDFSPVLVQAHYNHYFQAESLNSELRLDVCAYHNIPETPSGFRLTVNTAHLPAEFELVLSASLRGERVVPLALIRCKQRVLQLAQPSNAQPIILTAPGRTGSTWLMRLLAQHPEIVVHQKYPYEERKIDYWTNMFNVLTAPNNPEERFGKLADNSNVDLQKDKIFEQWLLDYLKEVSSFSQKNLNTYYRFLAADQNKGRVKYFAEKCSVGQSNTVPFIARKLYLNPKEIILVRDPRDLVASVQAFNHKRGYKDFGYEKQISDHEFIAGLSRTFSFLLKRKHSEAGSVHFVRYEDLILDPCTSLGKIFNYLELDSSPKTIEKVLQDASKDTPELVNHRTTRSGKVADSIGRWREDLNAESKEASKYYLGNILNELGYPLD